tara:strand:- start:1899 stop:2618 length:720 start_codon:yes stop_codon:yes gene_type:complete
MITLNKLVFDIKNIAYGGEISDDLKISERQIAFWVAQARALLIRQELSARMSPADSWIQHLPCVEVEIVDASECCEIDLGCPILKSKQKVPTTIKRNGRNSIFSVESLDGEYSYSETTSFRKKYIQHNKYTAKGKRWYLKNDYLYITGDKVTGAVALSAIFEDPEETKDFKTCSGDICFTWDSEYPIDMGMTGKITDIVLSTKMGIARQMPGDGTNNAYGEQTAAPAPKQKANAQQAAG